MHHGIKDGNETDELPERDVGTGQRACRVAGPGCDSASLRKLRSLRGAMPAPCGKGGMRTLAPGSAGTEHSGAKGNRTDRPDVQIRW